MLQNRQELLCGPAIQVASDCCAAHVLGIGQMVVSRLCQKQGYYGMCFRVRLTAGEAFCHLPEYVLCTAQVTTECRPQQLLEYLQGEAAKAASAAAVCQDRAKAEEDRLLEAARMALGVQHIIRICSRNDQPTVTEPLQRLVQHGPTVRQAVNLSGLHIHRPVLACAS